MNTLYDYMTYVKGIEYVLAVSFIGGYLLLWEMLKPKPFKTLKARVREDRDYLKHEGFRNTIKTLGMVVKAPFIGLMYVILLPLSLVYAAGAATANGMFSLAGKGATFGWRPSEAYLAGSKGRKDKKEDSGEKSEKKENN